MRRQVWNNKTTFTSVILFSLLLNENLSGQLHDHLITQLPNYPITQLPTEQASISSYLPKKGEIGAWQPVGSPEKAIGEDLFLLINGGAEIYHEYGFRQVVMQEYQNNSGKPINLELYEMTDPNSAFGIYTFKSSTEGKELPFGDGALLEDYYLNLWKGNFLVTATGFDSEKATIDGLVTIAKAVDEKIRSTAQKPQLVNLLPAEDSIKIGVKYMKGNLALFNSYDFAPGNIFGLKEGVIGDYGDYKLFFFKYDDKYESEKWFENAKANIRSNSSLSVNDMPANSYYSVFDKNEHRIFMKLYQDYIIVVVGSVTTAGLKIIEKVQSKI